MHKRYIGVTGFKTSDEVHAALHALDSLPASSTSHLMLGVKANNHTLAGKSHRWPAHYPAIKAIAQLFPLEPRTLNLIHYSTDEPGTLDRQLTRLKEVGGHHCDGFQLNIPWPDPKLLTPLGGMTHLLLKLNAEALEATGHDPQHTAERLDDYTHLISDVQVSGSSRLDKPFDLGIVHDYVKAIRTRHPKLGIGIDGDFTPQSVSHLEPLLRQYPTLNMHAGGRLRTRDDEHLDLEAMKTYIVAADRLHRQAKAVPF